MEGIGLGSEARVLEPTGADGEAENVGVASDGLPGVGEDFDGEPLVDPAADRPGDPGGGGWSRDQVSGGARPFIAVALLLRLPWRIVRGRVRQIIGGQTELVLAHRGSGNLDGRHGKGPN